MPYRARKVAKRFDIPWALFNSLISHESGWNPNAHSPAGAIGLGQLMPGTAQSLGVNPYNPHQNLVGSARYLSQQYKNFGKWNLALSAYNSGPGGAEAGGHVEGFPETQAYVRSIMADYAGRNNTGPSGFTPATGHGSFTAADPASIAEARRKQAALTLLSGNSSFPGQSQGMNPVLMAAVGNKIGSQIANKKYKFDYGMPGGGGGGGGNPQNLDNAALMQAIVALAQKRGFTVGENPRWGGVNPVHTGQSSAYGDFSGSGGPSMHYQTFGKHPGIGRAVDINWYGNAPSATAAQAIESRKLLQLFRTIRHRYGLGNIEELLLPGRTYFNGAPISHSTYSGHDNHMHLGI